VQGLSAGRVQAPRCADLRGEEEIAAFIAKMLDARGEGAPA
jgi:hypothetical protein